MQRIPLGNRNGLEAVPCFRLLLVIGLAASLAACASTPAQITPVGAAPALNAEPTLPVDPIPTATALPPTLAPSGTPPPTPLPTQTPVPLHPLTIDWLRQQTFPGSQIVFEEILEPGWNYDRFIISYQSEGNTIYSLLTIPRGERPPTGWPVIIFNHGYIPPEQYRTTERYVAYVDGFASHGYIVLRSDYRGHGNSEGSPTGAYSSPGYTVDVLNAVSSIKMYPDADPNRIGMWGHSMGGYITLRAMVVSPDIKAGVIWGGVVASYPDMFEHWWSARDANRPTPTPNPSGIGRGRWRITLIDMYGTPEENPEFWASISANSYLADLSGPIQLHHGTADETVPFKLSELLYAEGQAIGAPIDIWLWDGDNHNLSISFDSVMIRSIMFFDEHVKGVQ